MELLQLARVRPVVADKNTTTLIGGGGAERKAIDELPAKEKPLAAPA